MCKAFGFSLEEENAIAKTFESYEMSDIDKMLSGEIPTLEGAKPAIAYVKQYPELFDCVRKLDGLPKSFGLHACGKVVSTRPLNEFLPSCYDANGIRYLQGDMHDVEDVGLVKVDILGLRTIDQEYDTLEQAGEDVSFLDPRQDYSDDKVLDIFRSGDTVGVFQMSSGGMKQTLKKMKVGGIEDLSIANALYRPGAMAYIDDFCRRRQGAESFEYLHPDLEPILRNTYGILVFQEQLIAIGRMAGIKNPDLLRKATGKKDIALLNKIQPELKEKLLGRGWSEEQFNQLWEDMLAFGRYSFNKCVAGDTLVKTYTGLGFYFGTESIASLYHTPYYDDSFLESMDENHGIIRNRLVNIQPSGYRPVFLISTEDGATVECTGNHKIPTTQGVKTVNQLNIGDVVFVRDDSGHCVKPSRIKLIMYTRDTMTYDVTMAAPNHNFITSSGLVVCNSHASAYAIISYMTAKEKAYYPAQFFAGLCNSYIGKSDFVKEKAEEIIGDMYAHQIYIAPFDFRQDHRRCNVQEGKILYGVPLISELNETVADVVYALGQKPPQHFWQALQYLYANHVDKSQTQILILLGFFQMYGSTRQLIKIKDCYSFFKCGEAKKIQKSKLEYDSKIYQIITAHSSDISEKTGEVLKNFTVLDMVSILDECEEWILSVPISDLDVKTRLANQRKYLGFAPIASGLEEDRRKLVVGKIYPAVRKKDGKRFGWNITASSLGSGKQSRYTVFNKEFDTTPLSEGDVIEVIKYTSTTINGVRYYNLNDYKKLF